MTTVRTITSTTTRQTLTRELADLDPKVRNQIPVVVIAIAAGIAGLVLGHLSLLEAGGIAGPPTLALLIAYITTSTHRDLILNGIKVSTGVIEDTAPLVEAALPEAAPVIEDAESLAAAVSNGVLDSTTTIPTLPAPLAAPAQ